MEFEVIWVDRRVVSRVLLEVLLVVEGLVNTILVIQYKNNIENIEEGVDKLQRLSLSKSTGCASGYGYRKQTQE